MRKLFAYLPLIVFIFLFVGCNNELTVNLKQSGTLTPYVLDENGKGIEGATFFIKYYDDYSLAEGITDHNGTVDPIVLIQGNYICNASIQKDKFVYKEEKMVQIITDENTRVELKPFENIGTLSVHIANWYDEYSIANLNVALVEDYYYDLNECIENAFIIKKIGETGKLNFANIPVGGYYLVIYNDDKNYREIAGRFYITKNETTTDNVYIDYWEYYYE